MGINRRPQRCRPAFAATALACFLALGACPVSMAATPVVSRITPAEFLTGQWVSIHGKGLKETSAIWSEGVSERFRVVSDTEIKWFVNPLSAPKMITLVSPKAIVVVVHKSQVVKSGAKERGAAGSGLIEVVERGDIYPQDRFGGGERDVFAQSGAVTRRADSDTLYLKNGAHLLKSGGGQVFYEPKAIIKGQDEDMRGHYRKVQAINLCMLDSALKEVVSYDAVFDEYFERTKKVVPAKVSHKVVATHRAKILATGFSGDSRRVSSLAEDGQLEVRDMATGRVVESVEVTKAPKVSLAAIVPGDGPLALVFDKKILLWDRSKKRTTATLVGHKDQVTALAASGDGKRLVSGALDGTVIVWDVAKAAEIMRYRGDEFKVRYVALSPKGDRVASANLLGRLSFGRVSKTPKLVDVPRKEPLVFKDEKTIDGLIFSPDGRYMVSVGILGFNYETLLWSVDELTKGVFKPWIIYSSAPIMQFTPDGKSLLVAYPGKVLLHSISERTKFARDPRGSRFADPTPWQMLPVRVFELGHSAATALAVSPDGRRFVVADADKTVRVMPVGPDPLAIPKKSEKSAPARK